MIYVAQCILLYLTALICFGSKLKFDRNKNIFMLLSMLVLFFIIGFRDISVGVDTANYALYFKYMGVQSWKDILSGVDTHGLEIGYRILFKFFHDILGSYYVFQIFYAIIYCALSANFIKKTVPNYFFGFVLYLGVGMTYQALNIQRQMLAVIVVVNGFLYLREKKYLHTVILFVIGILLQNISIVFLTALIIYQLRDNKWIMRLMPIGIVLVAVNYRSFIQLARVYFPRYGNYYVNQRVIQTASGIWAIWIIIIVLSIYSLYVKKNRNEEFKVYCILSIIYVVCNIIGLYFNYFERLGLYFIPFVPAFFYYFGKQILDGKYRICYYSAAAV